MAKGSALNTPQVQALCVNTRKVPIEITVQKPE
jgi:hypothetical protein